MFVLVKMFNFLDELLSVLGGWAKLFNVLVGYPDTLSLIFFQPIIMNLLDAQEEPLGVGAFKSIEYFALNTGFFHGFSEGRLLCVFAFLDAAFGEDELSWILSGIDEEESTVCEVYSIQAIGIACWTISNPLQGIIIKRS